MMRAYALGQGASAQAFVGITWMLISGTEATGFLKRCADDIRMVNQLVCDGVLDSWSKQITTVSLCSLAT